MSDQSLAPRPVLTPLTKPFWDGAAEGKLVIQRCRVCAHFNHPPFVECTNCRSSDLGYEAVSGRGAIHQRAIVETPLAIPFDDLPYACLLVELDEQKHLLVAGNLVNASPYEARVGRKVEVVFETQPDGFVLPQFQLAADEAAA
jgi:uncharacterized OB-fold protein